MKINYLHVDCIMEYFNFSKVLDTGAFVDTLYTWAAFNTESIGQYLGSALKILAEKIPHNNIHLIGHSLGAHV